MKFASFYINHFEPYHELIFHLCCDGGLISVKSVLIFVRLFRDFDISLISVNSENECFCPVVLYKIICAKHKCRFLIAI